MSVATASITGLRIRRTVLRYGAFVLGLAIVLQFLSVLPIVGTIPSPFLLPILPVSVLGLGYWLLSGRSSNSIAVWIILGVISFGMMWTGQIQLGFYMLLSVISMIAFSALVVDDNDWLIACRYFLAGFLVSVLILFASYMYPSLFLVITENRIGWIRNQAGLVIMDPNQTGYQAGFAALVGLSLWRHCGRAFNTRSNRILGGFTIGVALLLILLTESRGSMAAILGSIAISILLGPAITRRRVWLLIAAVSTVIVLLLAFVQPAFVQRLLRMDEITTANGRTAIWGRALDLSVSDPKILLFGAGTMDGAFALGRFDPSLSSILNFGAPPRVPGPGEFFSVGTHSTYISWLLDFGLVGVLLASIALGLGVIRARSVDKGEFLALGQSMIAFFLLVSVSLTAYQLNGISIACGGMALGYLFHRRAGEEPVCGKKDRVTAHPPSWSEYREGVRSNWLKLIDPKGDRLDE